MMASSGGRMQWEIVPVSDGEFGIGGQVGPTYKDEGKREMKGG